MRSFLALIAVLLVAPLAARADSWSPPQPQAHLSPDQSTRFTVTPRGVIDEAAYWTEMRRLGPARAGQKPDSAHEARGLLERRKNDGAWTKIWEGPLVNPVGPPRVLVIDGGRHVATFGDWHGYGVGPNAVTIYGAGGRLVRTLALTDFLPKDYVDHLPKTAGSVRWDGSGEHRVSSDGGRLILQVVAPFPPKPTEPRVHRYAQVEIRLADGSVVPPVGPVWDRALAELAAYADRRKASGAR